MMVTQRRQRLRKRLGPKRTAYLLATYVKPGVQHGWLCKKLRIAPATLWRILAEHGVAKKPLLGDNTAPYGLLPAYWSRIKGQKRKPDVVSADEKGKACEKIYHDAFRLSAARIKIARRFSSPCLDAEDAAQEAVLVYLEHKHRLEAPDAPKRNKYTPYIMAMNAGARAVHSSLAAAYLPHGVGRAVMDRMVRRDPQSLVTSTDSIFDNEREFPGRWFGAASMFVSAQPGGLRPGREPTVHHVDAGREIIDEVRCALDRLEPRMARIMTLLYGLEDGRERSLLEIGKIMRRSRERIRQIGKVALRKLAEPLYGLRKFLASRPDPEPQPKPNTGTPRLSVRILRELYATRGFEPAMRRELAAIHKILCQGVGMTELKALMVWVRHGIEPSPSCSVLRRQAEPVLREALWRLGAKRVS